MRPTSSSSRVRQRATMKRRVTRVTNSAVSSLNSLFSNPTSTHQAYHDSTNPNFSLSTSRAHAFLTKCAARYVRRGGLSPDPDLIGGGHNQPIQSPPMAATTPAPNYHCPSQSIPLSSTKVSLPSTLIFANLLDILPPDLAALYSAPSPELLDPDGVSASEKEPAAFSVESQEEYSRLVCRLRDLGMVDFTLTPKVVNGVFATPKDDGRQRLIIDARRGNARFLKAGDAALPGPDLLANLEVPEGEMLYAAKADLDNFYHRIRLPQWLWSYFALPPVLAEDVGLDLLFGKGVSIYPCCTTMPMGWSHAVFLAQAAHVHQATGAEGLAVADQLTRGRYLH